MQQAELLPSSQLLLTDLLFLVRDAIDLALGQESATPAWAAAYGYHPGRSPFYPLTDPVWKEVEGGTQDGASMLSHGAGWPEPPPLPGNPTMQRRKLQGSDGVDYSPSDYEDYNYE